MSQYLTHIDERYLKAVWPRASSVLIKGIVESSEDAFEKFKISEIAFANIIGQCTVESIGATTLKENLYYTTPERIVAVFGPRHSAKVTLAEARKLIKNPKALAERVYGTGNPRKMQELGNKKSGDAFRYSGKGILQLTGKQAYEDVGMICGLSLVENPDMACDPKYALIVMLAFFEWKKVMGRLDTISVPELTRVVNGGQMHLQDRIIETRKAKNALKILSAPKMRLISAPIDKAQVENVDVDIVDNNSDSGDYEDDAIVLANYGETNFYVEKAQDSLVSLGYFCGAKDGNFGNLFRDALIAYQTDNNLNIDGTKLTKDDLDSISSPLAKNRTLADARRSATANSPALKESFTIRMMNKLKAIGFSLLAMVGIDVSGDTSVPEVAKKVIGERSTLVEFFGYVQSVVKIILSSPYLIGAIALIGLYFAYSMINNRVEEHRDGRNIGR